jgi:acetylornithine deacetylase/succinyl-diaminopimelate desuccinylase-like protein
MLRTILWMVMFAWIASFVPEAGAQTLSPADQTARDIFKQLIEINTTDSVGNVSTAAQAMAERLRNAGFAEDDLHLAGPNDRKRNLVVRFRGAGKRKPILFIGHLDVVEALRQDWTTDPFEFLEKDGYFYGRGTEDMKEGDAILVTNFIRLKKEGFRPDRDLILALTADEEGGSANGVNWLLEEHRDWIDAEYCINLDGGEFEKENGKPILAAIQASEKVYVDFQFESRNPGGHSSVPTPDNAIYHLAGALVRVQSFSFPLHLNEITRNYFERMAALGSRPESADMKAVVKQPPDPAAARRLSSSAYYNSLLHTTCVATMLSGGHAPNALPQTARANVNCRIFPGEDPQEILKTLGRVANDPKVKISIVPQTDPEGKAIRVVPVPPSPLLPEVTQAMEKTLSHTGPGIPLVSTMSTGATDGKYTRIAGIPTYGVSCMFFDKNDDRSHGKDERVGVQDFYDGVAFNYKLIRELSTPH